MPLSSDKAAVVVHCRGNELSSPRRLYVTNLIKLINRVRDPMSMEMTLITSTVDIGDCADFRSAIKESEVEEWCDKPLLDGSR